MRILILFPHSLWQTKMSFVRRHVIRALMRHPGIECHLSGQEWPDYDDLRSLQWNMDHIFPDADAVFWYKPLGSKSFRGIIDADKCKALKVESYNEAWWQHHQAQSESTSAGTNLVICHHQNDLHQFPKMDAVHIPHCAEKSLFLKHAQPWEKRNIPCLVTGVQSKEIYPLRSRLAGMVQSGLIPGSIRNHPGYRLRNVEQCDQQAEDYAFALGHTKIAISCTSKYRYRLAKIPEAAMAGCRVASDIPDENKAEHKRFMLSLSMDMTDSEMSRRINDALNDEDNERLASAGQSLMLEEYTQERYCKRLVAAISERL